MIYRNVKTGKLYRTQAHEFIDETNATNGRHMVVYGMAESKIAIYVRERNEFTEKFAAVCSDVEFDSRVPSALPGRE